MAVPKREVPSTIKRPDYADDGALYIFWASAERVGADGRGASTQSRGRGSGYEEHETLILLHVANGISFAEMSAQRLQRVRPSHGRTHTAEEIAGMRVACRVSSFWRTRRVIER